MDPLTVTVVIDYQNIHLTARDTFAPPGVPAHECLIHPLKFAEEVLKVRSAKLAVRALTNPGTAPTPPTELVSVQVFRGQPSNREQSRLYAYTQAHRSEWTRDARVEVEYRTLRYFWEDGVRVAQEKGIDVRVALALVRAVTTARSGLVILASHDTDLEPALDAGAEWGDGSVLIETAGWSGARVLRPKVGVRHTSLDAINFLASRDRKPYG